MRSLGLGAVSETFGTDVEGGHGMRAEDVFSEPCGGLWANQWRWALPGSRWSAEEKRRPSNDRLRGNLTGTPGNWTTGNVLVRGGAVLDRRGRGAVLCF